MFSVLASMTKIFKDTRLVSRKLHTLMSLGRKKVDSTINQNKQGKREVNKNQNKRE